MTALLPNPRRFLVLSGNPAWCIRSAVYLLANWSRSGEEGQARCLWIGKQAHEGWPSIPAGRAEAMLGRELDAVVYNAYSGFDLDAFGAISGTIRGGGALLLLTPPLAGWPGYADPEYARLQVYPLPLTAVSGRYLHYLVDTIRSNPEAEVLGPGDALPPPLPLPPRLLDTHPAECRTPDQSRAVEAIVKVVSGQRRRPVVLTSDRGRGKSAALGIAAARLLRDGTGHIVVTGPRLDAVQPVYAHARRLLPEAKGSRADLRLAEARMEYLPPDQLARSPVVLDLLLVDEAAAIPTPLLEQLLHHYPRIAFATTVHGYEGTGRGFALRFHQVLDRRTRGWRAVRMETPIRWGPDDPLERFVFRALLLDAEIADDAAVAGANPADCEVLRLDRDALVEDRETLSGLFGLLVQAHYRTRPYDLRHLLDGPNLWVYALRVGGILAATALVALEGGLDETAGRAVYNGTRRPHGHLLPEALTAHMGLEGAIRLGCARIMRIAVHPSARRKGLGSRLIATIMEDARLEGLDYMGSSFGATPELLRFWRGCGLWPVRLGVKRGAASGAHSAIVLAGLSAAGADLYRQAREGFLDQLPHALCDPLRELDPGLALELLRREQAPAWPLNERDRRDITAFAHGLRVYETCLAPLWRLACVHLADPGGGHLLEPLQRRALVVKVLQKRGWGDAAAALEVAGRKQVIEVLRGAFRTLLGHRTEERAGSPDNHTM